LALGESAITDWAPETENERRPKAEQAIEVFCNKVAAAILMPTDAFLESDLVRRIPVEAVWTDQDVATLARIFSVSPEAALRRLLTLKRITPAFYQSRRRAFEEAYRKIAEKPSKAVVLPHKRALGTLGPALSRLLLDTYYERRITLADLTGYFGISVPWVAKLEMETQRRAHS
jgi:Zn-dependent peptidase ImmA (M78 family)